MNIPTLYKMSKQLLALRAAHPEKISDAYRDSDGVWLELNPGWCIEASTHTMREDTVADVLREFRRVAPCTCCPECRAVHPELPASPFPHRTAPKPPKGGKGG